MVFVSSVTALFFVARQGQTQVVMYVAFAFFLITATLWVRGLDSNWIAGREDYRSKFLLVFALAVPIVVTVLTGIFREGAASTLVLGGAITVYIGAGLAVRKLRWWVIQHSTQPRTTEATKGETAKAPRTLESRLAGWFVTKVCRWWVLVILLLGAYGALWLLGRVPMAVAGPLLLIVVFLIPALVHVLSERRIIRLSSHGTRSRNVWIVGGALAAALGLGVGVLHLSETRYLLALLIVVAALMWAFAVGSLADVAAVLAALALMGVTPASQDVKPAILEAEASGSGEAVVVSLGDSYSSGEGASRYLDDTNVAGNQCRRAATAWPVLVAQSLGAQRLVFRACSGARARNLVGVAGVDQQYAGEGIQVDRALQELRSADSELDPALVVLSIGGNDAGFRQVGSSCLSLDSCNDEDVSKYFYGNLPEVEKALTATYLAIAEKFPDSPIAVMPYPDAFASDDGCARAPVESGDITFVREFTDSLDSVIEQVAAETGVYYVADMRTALSDSDLALCDESGTPGLNFLDLRGVGGAALDRFNPGNWIHNSLHPNERGHAALAAAFTGWLASQERADDDGNTLTGLGALLSAKDKRAEDDVPEPSAAHPVPTKSSTTLCFEKDGGDCGPEADDWALARLGPGMFLPLLLAGLVAAGTWACAVGVSAWRFQRRSRRR